MKEISETVILREAPKKSKQENGEGEDLELVESLLDRQKGFFAAERTLDLLEQYQIAITDPNESPDVIRTLVSSLHKQMKDIARWEDKLTSDPLQKILIELEILSSVQIARFRRGDII